MVRTWDGAERTGVNAAYVRSVLAAGGVPLHPLARSWGRPTPMRALDGVDGLLLTGGEDIHPAWYGAEPSPHLDPPSRERDLFELALFAAARQRELPILGICRGIQLVNVALGGTLFQDLPSERPGPVAHDPGGAARRARPRGPAPGGQPGRRARSGATAFSVNSFHHQAVGSAGAAGWSRRAGARTD